MADSASLRQILLDELTSLREGKTDAGRAKAVAAVSNSILKSVEVEMAYREQTAKIGKTGGGTLGAMPLTLAGESAVIEAEPYSPTGKNGRDNIPPKSESSNREPAAIPAHLMGAGARKVEGKRY